MTDPTPDRPLVTFALFAYNQEQYIREAVKGAFSQTYEPLEIILSDDCSSDRTFEIMREMAAEYEGPHKVKVRRNTLNLGTAQHVQSAFDASAGELFVVAAGDDISLPERVDVLVQAWLQNNKRAVILHSFAEAFDEDRPMSERQLIFPFEAAGQPTDMALYLRHHRLPILPPTAAYARSIFFDFKPLIGGSVIEDGPLCFRGFLKGEGAFFCVELPLVINRRVILSAGSGYDISDLARWSVFLRSRMISNMTRLQDLRSSQCNAVTKTKLEKYFLASIRRLGCCFFKENDKESFLGRLKVFLIVLFVYPISYTLRGRIFFALNFSHLIRPGVLLLLRKQYRKLRGSKG